MRPLAGFLLGTSVAVALTACAAAIAALTLPAGSIGATVSLWLVFAWWLPGLAGGLFGTAAGLWLDERSERQTTTPSVAVTVQRSQPPWPSVRIATPPRRSDRQAAAQRTEQRA